MSSSSTGNVLTSTPGRGESDKDVLVATNLRLEALVVQHDNLGRGLALDLWLNARLILNEGAQALQIAAALVILGGVALAIEPLEGGEALDAKLLAQRAVRVGVDLCHADLVLCVLEHAAQLLPHGRQVLAVPAPRREEFDQRWLARLEHDVVEVVGDEVEDGGAGGRAEQGEPAEDREADHCEV